MEQWYALYAFLYSCGYALYWYQNDIDQMQPLDVMVFLFLVYQREFEYTLTLIFWQ